MKPASDLSETIGAIHAHPAKGVIALAGAGSYGLAWLHAIAGSSRTILEARDLYASQAMERLIGPAQPAVSGEIAERLATWAFGEAHSLMSTYRLTGEPFGLSCTAAIRTDRQRRGLNHAFICMIAARGLRWQAHLILGDANRSRLAEEALVSRLLIAALAAGIGLPPPDLLLAEADELLIEETSQ